jgi:DNA-directed RNA polymerase II subunit RPB1
MATYPETYESVEFYPLGNDENYEDSYVEITKKDLFRRNVPIPNGAYDAHLGTTDDSWRCQSCFNTKRWCPGHEGHINLNYPVQNHLYKNDLLRWLKIICHSCGKLVVNKTSDILKVPKLKRLNKHTTRTRNTKGNISCAHCGYMHPYVVRDQDTPIIIWAEYYQGNNLERRYRIFNHMIATIFERISPEIVTLMGKPLISHPRKFIISVMRVSPNTIRPDIKKIGGGRSNSDDLTTLTKAIIDINNKLPAIIPDEIPNNLETDYTNLDLAYYALIKDPKSSTKTKIMSNTNRPPGSIENRIVGKKGRVRQNLMGFRVFWCGRSVITCDSTIRVDELGIPLIIAKEIQIPETVTPYNKDRLMIYFNNKRNLYPGCTKIKKKNTGVQHWVGALRRDFKVEIGDVIMRDMIDGDVIIFNRQPSMDGPSMTCHKAVIIREGKTFRMNISACILYNADFDGDEMNIHVACSAMARNEIENLSGVGNAFISRAEGKPLIGCFQDTMVSIAKMTHNDVKISKESAMGLFKDIPVKLDKDIYTGRELISKLLPPINFNKVGLFYNKAYAPYLKYKEDEVKVIINRGEIAQGILDNKSCGQGRRGSIFHIIHNEYGPNVALDTLFNIQQVTMQYGFNTGFTVAMDDITIPKESIDKIQEKTSALIMEANRITDKLKKGEIIPPINRTVEQFYEQQQINALTLGDEFVEPIVGSIDPLTNSLYVMTQMCKKGSMKHFQAISSSIGSSLINGQRPVKSFGYARTLPYCTRFDTDPISNGFIPDSYMTGVNPISYMFTTQEARYGEINKSLSTSVAGQQNRESIKNFESIVVNNLRQSSKNRNVVQFIYGNDGLDSRRVVKVKIPTIMISDKELRDRFKSDIKMFESKFHTDKVKKLLEDEFNYIKQDRNLYRENFLNTEIVFDDGVLSSEIKLSVDVNKIISDVSYDFKDTKKEKMDPIKTIELIDKFCKNFVYVFLNSTQEEQQSRVPDKFIKCVEFHLILFRSYLNTRTLIKRNINYEPLKIILDKIRYTTQKSLIEYGIACGIISAQSISSPMTQYIIDSHHRASVGGGENDMQTDTLTRTKELLGAKPTEKMQNPSMLLFVKPEYEDNKIKVTEIANHIETMKFRRFISKLQIFFEDYGKPIHPDYVHEEKMIHLYNQHNPNITVPNDITKWVIRFELNKLNMIVKNMNLENIIYSLNKNFPDLFIVYNSENSKNIIIRCYIRNSMLKRSHVAVLNDIVGIKETIVNSVIRGIKDIRIATVIRKNVSYVDSDGEIKTKKIYAIKTVGTNLSSILENDYLDVDKCQTDSIKEIEEVFGIEAARYKLRAELQKATWGDNTSQAHYSIYADELCITGKVTSVSKSGLSIREPNNTLLGVSYSHISQALELSSINNRKGKVYGVSAPLMLGGIPRVGSTYNKIAIDYDFLKEHTNTLSDLIDDL